jgi:hypothetical protein
MDSPFPAHGAIKLRFLGVLQRLSASIISLTLARKNVMPLNHPFPEFNTGGL